MIKKNEVTTIFGCTHAVLGRNDTVPCQLESFQYSVSPDPDRFRYYVIELSWDKPCSEFLM